MARHKYSFGEWQAFRAKYIEERNTNDGGEDKKCALPPLFCV